LNNKSEDSQDQDLNMSFKTKIVPITSTTWLPSNGHSITETVAN